jgi:WD40 repeat protein
MIDDPDNPMRLEQDADAVRLEGHTARTPLGGADAAAIQAALQPFLAPEHQAALQELASLLARVISGALPPDQAGGHLGDAPALAEVLRALTDHNVKTKGVELCFGGDTITIGNIIGSEAVATGHGAIAIKIAIQSEQQAYNVSELSTNNPYLGLRAFSYAERNIFAGRESIVRALVECLSAENGDRLLFIIGASGGGKSSLVRAGLLPALEDRLAADGVAVQTRIVDHPSRAPIGVLARLLQPGPASADASLPPMILLLLDQFEEFFSQVDSHQRDQAFSLLAAVAGRTDPPVRIIATMRSDFLPHLVTEARFDAYERRKVVLRAMKPDELCDAIQRPIQVRHPAKKFETALVKRLAQDAAADAAYLPLLQVTLEDLWRGGDLRLSAYHGMANAIQRRADTVYTFRDYDDLQQQLRPTKEQKELLAILLDLIRVAPSAETGEVRWRRNRTEVTQGDPLRERLVDDLAHARLLRVEGDTVDLIHEALLTGWPRLREAIGAERDHLRRRERFLLALDEWLTHNRHDDYLLSGVRLAESETLLQQGDGVFQRAEAEALVQRSAQQRDAKRRREIWRLRMFVGVLSVFLIVALGLGAYGLDRQLAAEQNAATARTAEALAIQQRDIAEIRQAAAQALNDQSRAAQRSLLLATEALSRSIALGNTSDPMVEESLRQILASTGGIPLRSHTAAARVVAVSPDDRRIASGDVDGRILLWSATEHPAVDIELRGHTSGVSGLVFRPDGRSLVSSSWDGTVRIWDLVAENPGDSAIVFEQDSAIRTLALSADGQWLATGTAGGKVWLYQWSGEDGFSESLILQEETNPINIVAFSPDSTWLAAANEGGTIGLWRITTAGLEKFSLSGHEGDVTALAFSKNSRYFVTGGHDATILFWSLLDGKPSQEPVRLQRHTSHINALSFSPDERWLASSSWGKAIRVWYVEDIVEPCPCPGKELKEVFLLTGHTYGVNTIAFSPDGKYLLSGSEDQTIRLWDTNDYTRSPLVLYGHDSSVVSLQFSSQSQWWVSTGWKDRSPRIWPIAAPVLEPRTFYGPWA